MPCRCSSDTRKFAIKTFYKGNLRFVFVNHLQAVKHESNKHNKQDHGGLPIITITGRKSVCQSIRSLIHPDYSPLSRGTRVPTITVYEVTEALINIKRTASGPGDIPYWLFRDFGYQCLPSATIQFHFHGRKRILDHLLKKCHLVPETSRGQFL